jgi:hypothetical protein
MLVAFFFEATVQRPYRQRIEKAEQFRTLANYELGPAVGGALISPKTCKQKRSDPCNYRAFYADSPGKPS